ncbi:hypothetical protein GPALN_005303 [Globodera pallida]|nr:hypothetical protein GPALN_005303 [Globodera pallida]
MAGGDITFILLGNAIKCRRSEAMRMCASILGDWGGAIIGPIRSPARKVPAGNKVIDDFGSSDRSEFKTILPREENECENATGYSLERNDDRQWDKLSLSEWHNESQSQ